MTFPPRTTGFSSGLKDLNPIGAPSARPFDSSQEGPSRPSPSSVNRAIFRRTIFVCILVWAVRRVWTESACDGRLVAPSNSLECQPMAWYCLLREVEQRSGCLGMNDREHSNEIGWLVAAVESDHSRFEQENPQAGNDRSRCSVPVSDPFRSDPGSPFGIGAAGRSGSSIRGS